MVVINGPEANAGLNPRRCKISGVSVPTNDANTTTAKSAKEKLTGVPKTEQHKENMRGKRPHVSQSGSKNNNAKIIQTPYGIFGSIREASQQIEGYTYKMIWNRLQNDKEWRYV